MCSPGDDVTVVPTTAQETRFADITGPGRPGCHHQIRFVGSERGSRSEAFSERPISLLGPKRAGYFVRS